MQTALRDADLGKGELLEKRQLELERAGIVVSTWDCETAAKEAGDAEGGREAVYY